MAGDPHRNPRQALGRRLGTAVLVAALTLPMTLRPQLWQFLTEAVMVYEFLRRIGDRDEQSSLDQDSADRPVTGEKPLGTLSQTVRRQQFETPGWYDLSDAAARQYQDPVQQQVVKHLPDLYFGAEAVGYGDAIPEFQHAFFDLAGQWAAMDHSTLLCPAASSAIDIVAASLGVQSMSAAILEPCSDRLSAAFRRRGVRLTAVSEGLLAQIASGNPKDLPRRVDKVDALLVSLPNDPTGFTLSPTQFKRLAQYCAKAGTVLIIDWTFRFFEHYETWDAYAILNRSGVSYICVEDTAKTFPTRGLTCAVLAASPDLHSSMAKLHSDATFDVSPVTLRLLTACLREAGRLGLDAAVRECVQTNRRSLHQALRGSVLVPDRVDQAVSVEWVRIDSEDITSQDLVRLFDRIGVGVLPGNQFHWAEPSAGSNHLRFALARDTAMFEAACGRLQACIRNASELTVVVP